MQRRNFLIESSMATLGLALSLPGDAQGTQSSAGRKDAFLDSLIARWETGIPT